MDTILSAAKALKQAEDQLKAFVQDALSKSNFAEARILVDAIAELASSRERLIGHGTNELGGNRPREASTTAKSEGANSLLVLTESVTTPVTPALRGETSHANAYPKFERDGDRLAKLGWSAKDKRVYEHRTDRETVGYVCEAISHGVRSKRPFKMEKFLPVHQPNGAEVPSYQAYLILKWLQHYGLIEKRGKDGYVLGQIPIAPEHIKELWERTPERSNSAAKSDIADGMATHG